MVIALAAALGVPSVRNSRTRSRLPALGVRLLPCRLMMLLVLTVLTASAGIAQSEVTGPDQIATGQTGDEAGVKQQQHQRTAATAMATLVGIALMGIFLLFMIVLLGTWTRRRALSRTESRGGDNTASEESAPARQPATPEADRPHEDQP